MEKITLYVTGVVQGVGYRYSTVNVATNLGLTGWVRNLDDGRVAIEAVGETKDLEALLQWCKQGPPHARVSGVEVASRETVDSSAYSDFHTR